MDTRPPRRMTVTIEADAFRRLAELAARERRAVRDQAAVELERALLGRDPARPARAPHPQPAEAGARGAP